ncbi:hypothetical protein [Algoriphagus boritolerans]|uniref:hypothetical protein n=1 Tax=Algoriphagus boritolerans TaxID=308111 RepID=UPI000B2D4788
MGSNFSIAAGETRGQEDIHLISPRPRSVEPISRFKIVHACGIFFSQLPMEELAKARKSLA